MQGYLTAAEIAQMLRTEPITVVRLCRAGKLPATKPAGKWLVHHDDLAAYLAATRNTKAAS